MSARWVIIDGYSLLYRMARETTRTRSELARRSLIHMLDRVGALIADRITVVFDGRSVTGDRVDEGTFVEVLFSPVHQTADTVIERLVCSASERRDILVVTSDIAERHTVEAAGATTISCGDFLEECKKASECLERTQHRSTTDGGDPTLGDFFPKSEK